MSSTLSPQQAADRVGASRWTINRALLSGDLKGSRNNRGHWKVDPSDVDAWAAENVRTEQHTEQRTEQQSPQEANIAHTFAVENAGLKVEVSQLRERLAEAQEHAANARSDLAEARKEREKFLEILARPRWPWSRRIHRPSDT
jgi:excisionase family DNA binding protein